MKSPFLIARRAATEGFQTFAGGSFRAGLFRFPDCLPRFLRDCSLRHHFTRSSALTPSTLRALLPQLIRQWREGVGTAKSNFSSHLIPKPWQTGRPQPFYGDAILGAIFEQSPSSWPTLLRHLIKEMAEGVRDDNFLFFFDVNRLQNGFATDCNSLKPIATGAGPNRSRATD